MTTDHSCLVIPLVGGQCYLRPAMNFGNIDGKIDMLFYAKQITL